MLGADDPTDSLAKKMLPIYTKEATERGFQGRPRQLNLGDRRLEDSRFPCGGTKLAKSEVSLVE